MVSLWPPSECVNDVHRAGRISREGRSGARVKGGPVVTGRGGLPLKRLHICPCVRQAVHQQCTLNACPAGQGSPPTATRRVERGWCARRRAGASGGRRETRRSGLARRRDVRTMALLGPKRSSCKPPRFPSCRPCSNKKKERMKNRRKAMQTRHAQSVKTSSCHKRYRGSQKRPRASYKAHDRPQIST